MLPEPDRRLPPRRPAARGRAAGPGRPRPDRLGGRRRRLVGAAHRPGPGARHGPRTASCAPTCWAAATARPARPRSTRGPARRTAAPSRRSRPADQARAQWRLLDALGIDRARRSSSAARSAGWSPSRSPSSGPRPWPRHADRGTGRDRADGDRLEPPPDRAHRPARPRRPGARSPAGDDHLSQRGRLRRALRSRRSSPTAGRRSSATSTTRARKLVERFDPATYRILAGAMDRHDIGARPGRPGRRVRRLARPASRLTGVGIEDDILYGPRQVRGAGRRGGGGRRRRAATARSARPRATMRSWSSGTSSRRLREALSRASMRSWRS